LYKIFVVLAIVPLILLAINLIELSDNEVNAEASIAEVFQVDWVLAGVVDSACLDEDVTVSSKNVDDVVNSVTLDSVSKKCTDAVAVCICSV
jgi:hypothetical protein